MLDGVCIELLGVSYEVVLCMCMVGLVGGGTGVIKNREESAS